MGDHAAAVLHDVPGPLVLVFVLSFYAGTLKPKGPTGLSPASVPAAPGN